MKIALFKSTSAYQFTLPYTREDNDLDRPVFNMLRVSEWQDVAPFVMLPPEATAAAELAALDAERASVTKEFADKLQELNDRRQTLLALTHEPAVAG